MDSVIFLSVPPVGEAPGHGLSGPRCMDALLGMVGAWGALGGAGG
jgi:hypothetical protein